VLAAALFAAAALVGSAYVRAFDRTGARTATDLRTLPSRSMWYGQHDFGAAVALACGRGYVDPGYELTPGLTRFLALQADRFSCAELPATLPPRELNITQRLYRYLLASVAAVWAIRGVSWSALWPLFGLLYGATVAVCYGLFRLGMGRPLASAAAVAIAISPVHLGNLPGLRDYAKAPFILGLFLIAAWIARRARHGRSVLALSALFGGVLGVGFGFRNDLVIVVPLFLVALMAWDPPRDVRAAVNRMGAIAVAAAAFVVVALPILSGYTRGSNSGHVALMGLMTTFDQPLGIADSVYEWGHVYSDGYGDAMIKSYSYRVHGSGVEYLSADYDRAMFEYLLQIARHWPADMLTRAYAAILKMVDLPFAPGVNGDAVPYGIDGGLRRLYEWYNAVVGVLHGKGVIAVALVLLMISRSGVWPAVMLLAALFYVAGYPAIQFQPRHFFHLEFIAWFALAFLAQRLVAAGAPYVRDRGAERPEPRMTSAPARRMAAFALIAGAVVILPLTCARWYQQRHMRTYLQKYVDAPRDRVAVDPIESGDRTLLRLSSLWSDRDPRRVVNTQYVVASFSPADCPVARLPVTFRYAIVNGQPDFSFDTVITFLPPRPVEIFFPAYDIADKSRLEGIEVPRGFEPCVQAIGRVHELARLPMLVNLTLAPGWDRGPLYQRLVDWEVPERGPFPSLYALPAALTVPARAMSADPIRPPLLWQAPMVRDSSPRGWSISGTPPSPEWPLLEFAPQPRNPDDRFVLEGEVVRGGITIGLVRDHKWTEDGHVKIVKPGRFVAVLAPSGVGDYGVLGASGFDDSAFFRRAPGRVVQVAQRFRDFNDVRISKAGWMPRE
jgi:hypothetical protein